MGGSRFSTTINGTLTGRGGDWIIIDDPLKASDGLSDVLRNKVNDWYATTLYSRLNNKNTGKILVIMQRLHQSDLTGYLLEKQSGFRHITIPMIAETDEDWSYTDKFGYRHDIARHAGELLHPINSALFPRMVVWLNVLGCTFIMNCPNVSSISFCHGTLRLRPVLQTHIRHALYSVLELIIVCTCWPWSADDWNTLLCCNVWHSCTPTHNEHTIIAQQPH